MIAAGFSDGPHAPTALATALAVAKLVAFVISVALLNFQVAATALSFTPRDGGRPTESAR
jgi:hypothetical protein